MSVGFSTLLFFLGTIGAVGSLMYTYKRKQSGTKSSVVIVIGIISCLLAVGSACYLVFALLLLGGIN